VRRDMHGRELPDFNIEAGLIVDVAISLHVDPHSIVFHPVHIFRYLQFKYISANLLFFGVMF
jgi:hypothetical protein